MSNKLLLGISGIGIYGTAIYLSYHTYRVFKLPEPVDNCHLPTRQENFSQKYHQLSNYDSKIEWDEFLMGMSSKRQRLIDMAQGDVLETSAGTCRNSYIPTKLSSLTLTDSCSTMLQHGLEKLRSFKKEFGKPVTCTIMESENLLYPDNSFDTVVDTFGMCSHKDPVKALSEMSRVCKPFGKILLLQHGRA
jgi:methyltransferase OMS1